MAAFVFQVDGVTPAGWQKAAHPGPIKQAVADLAAKFPAPGSYTVWVDLFPAEPQLHYPDGSPMAVMKFAVEVGRPTGNGVASVATHYPAPPEPQP